MRTTSLRTASAASRTASSPASRKFGALAHTLATDTLYLYKRRIATCYTSFTSLKSFLKVNYSGLRNILKKCDKLTHGDLPACNALHRVHHIRGQRPPGHTPRRADHFVDALEGAVPAQ
ncbi:hypothetical protein FB107DRAFT_204814 [Schizophyllum commune]